MTRRRLLCGLLFSLALLVCFAGLWLVSGPRGTRAKFERVANGMSREQVETTVGCPSNTSSPSYLLLPGVRATMYDTWVCDDAILAVHFDDADTAVDVHVRDADRGPTMFGRLRRWLGL